LVFVIEDNLIATFSSKTRSEMATCTKSAQAIERQSIAMKRGGLAQLGEHLLCKQGVVGSIPSTSTTVTWKLEVMFGCEHSDQGESLGWCVQTQAVPIFNKLEEDKDSGLLE
jgi:hypothetical protein